MKAINPATEALIRDYPEHRADVVEQRLREAHQAFSSWRRTRFAERADLLRRAAGLLHEGRAGYARLMTEEMGKPVAKAVLTIWQVRLSWDASHTGSLLDRRWPDLFHTGNATPGRGRWLREFVQSAALPSCWNGWQG
jgi:acyl-CoA reductase-like NAD-dependent aldehyde dehydrogenase